MAGRTAQAFVKDCAPDEPLIWTWQEHGRTVVRIEANPHQSLTGMCIDALILPHSATQPAQAKMTSLTDYFANLTAAGDPIIRSAFDVYISGGSLIYTKPQCGQADVDGRFFANIFPVDADVLPARLRQRGYETIDFNFDDYGAIADDRKCLAALNLQDYPIAEIHAGQYVEFADGYAHIWDGAYRFNE